MSNELILFVFEGQKTEKQIINAIQNQEMLLPEDKVLIVSCFCAEIYQLYKILKDDEYLEIFIILKEIEINKDVLNGYSVDDFSSIYLFFDYDPHANNGSSLDEKNQHIDELISFFSEETDKGKLFISYPMVEAIKNSVKCDSLLDFLEFSIAKENCVNFKKIMNELCQSQERSDIRKYDTSCWQNLFNFHCIKANYLVNESQEFPSNLISQQSIFEIIKTLDDIPILSSIPLMLCDYYGVQEFKSRCT